MGLTGKKIILVSHDGRRGGGELLLLHVARVLKGKYQSELIILLKDGGELIPDFKKYGEVYVLNELTTNDASFRDLFRTFRYRNFNCAICNTIVTGDIVAFLTAVGIYCISLIHEMPQIITSYNSIPYGVASAMCAQCVFFPSSIVYEKDTSLIDFPKNKIRIQPQGLYYHYVSEDPIKCRNHLNQQYNISPTDMIVLSVGYGCEIKGFDIFLDIAQGILKIRDDVHFMWVGDYDNVTFGDRIIGMKRRGKIKNIHFPGVILDSGIMAAIYSRAYIFLLPSREDSFPSVVLEAMNAGLPIIAFKDGGGFQDILKDDIGILVPYLNKELMKQKILELLTYPQKRELLVIKSKEKINEHISFEQYVEKLISSFPNEFRITPEKCLEAKNISFLINDYEKRVKDRDNLYSQFYHPKIKDLSNIFRNFLIRIINSFKIRKINYKLKKI